MTDDLLQPQDAGPGDAGERLREDVAEPVEPEADRDRDDAPGIGGPEHLGLTPPG